MTTNANLPAMPFDMSTESVVKMMQAANQAGDKRPVQAMLGLTKREMFAMAAMQGILANDSANLINPEIQEITSRLAVLCADALLAELERTK